MNSDTIEPRTCATPHCGRTTERPGDVSQYRFCRDCTYVVWKTGQPPTLAEPVLVRLHREKGFPAKALVA